MSNKLKPKYIGGSTWEARRDYYNYNTELSQILSNLASQYQVPAELVFNRLAHEGFIDGAIYHINDEAIMGDELHHDILSDDNFQYTDLFHYYGLDNAFNNYINGTIKTKRPINIKREIGYNEKEKIQTGNTKTVYDALELFVAELASRMDWIKKNYPNLNKQELISATAAKYSTTNKYFKQLMDSGEYKTKYAINNHGIKIPSPTKQDNKHIKDQNMEFQEAEIFMADDPSIFEYNNKSWNPKLFMPDDGFFEFNNPNGIMEQHFINNFKNKSFTIPSKANIIGIDNIIGL